MQEYIRQLLKEEGLYSNSEDSNGDDKDQTDAAPKAKRGRPKIPDKWTRVISVHNDDLSIIRTYELGPELLLDAGLGLPSQGRGRPAVWQPLFWPPHYKKEGHDFTTAGNVLTEHRLLELGERLTEFRARLRQAALTANEQETFSSPEDLHADLGKMATRIHKGYFTSLPKVDSGFSYNETPAPARKKGSRRP